ncbi:MAG: hypothetical protein R2779_04620 [Crocinitomicaceae bacterium]
MELMGACGIDDMKNYTFTHLPPCFIKRYANIRRDFSSVKVGAFLNGEISERYKWISNILTLKLKICDLILFKRKSEGKL